MTLVKTAGVGQACALRLALLLLPLASMTLAAQQPSRPAGRDIHAVVETDRATYRVGDTIRVRVSLANFSTQPITFSPAPPWALVSLVTARGGQTVKVDHKPWGDPGDGVATTLEAHQTVVWSWNKAEWFPLAAWGYELRESGTYTIHGIPQISGPWVAGDWKTVRSNTATITIRP
jgi:hypothetical protein